MSHEGKSGATHRPDEAVKLLNSKVKAEAVLIRLTQPPEAASAATLVT
jgi:hypothetical protein